MIMVLKILAIIGAAVGFFMAVMVYAMCQVASWADDHMRCDMEEEEENV